MSREEREFLLDCLNRIGRKRRPRQSRVRTIVCKNGAVVTIDVELLVPKASAAI